MFTLWLSLFIVIIVSSIYFWLQQRKNYWSQRNILNAASSFYFFGNNKHIAYYIKAIYERFNKSGQRFIGAFMLFTPVALILDLNLIKCILISDFDKFPDRGFYYNPHDPLTLNILRLDGDYWKRLRAQLTPTFSSGKLKQMFPKVVGIAERFVQLVAESTEQDKELEMRELCARYTTDVIGCVAFGIDCNSLRMPNTEFRRKGDEAFATFNTAFETLAAAFPNLFRALHIKVFSKRLINFFSNIVKENVAHREQNNIKRNDFLDLLIELKNAKVEEGKFNLSLDEVIGQSFIFFTGGFETSSATMSFCLYELSKHPAVQDKARKEILDTLARHNNEFTYESFRDMHYLEQIVLETLRMYPIAPTLKRVTRSNYQVPNTEFVIDKGIQVIIPVYAIHHNPEYYPAPEVFDPERFSQEQIKQRPAMTYLPFGDGPRTCIAERFGKMQALVGLASLLKNFKFSTTENTPAFLEFDAKNHRIFTVKSGISLKVEKY